MTESEYIKRISLEHRKKFAQFFTPMQVADFMANWVLNNGNGNAKILEPAFGLGVFTRSLYKINPNVKVKGYDIDNIIFSYARENFNDLKYNVSLINENYLTAPCKTKFDGIICNPPYLKFHDYDNTILIPQINNELHTRLSGFTNIYTLFLLKSISQLKVGGRLAYIVPSEFLNSDYGVEVKRGLLQSGTLRHIIIIDFTKCAFDDALTTACILLCENNSHTDTVRFSTINNIDSLGHSFNKFTAFASSELKPEIKWKQYYEEAQSSKYHHLVPFSTFARVTRGIATGANDFFTFKASKVDMFNLPQECFLPCICHAADVQDLVFTENDFERLKNSDKTVFLFNGKAKENEIHVKRYLKLGVANKINNKYLTSSRSPWYAVENRTPSPIWVSVFNRKGLRFVRNKSGAYNLTTFHCVYNIGTVDTELLFAYLITDMAKKIFLDNSRQYGNGLVKFEPNDLNKGKIVDLRLLTDKEKEFVINVSEKLQNHSISSHKLTELLNDFFREKYSSEFLSLHEYEEQLSCILNSQKNIPTPKEKAKRIKQLNFYDLLQEYGDSLIIENNVVCENGSTYNTRQSKKNAIPLDEAPNVQIGLVRKDVLIPFENHAATIYYTGKRFPSIIQLNHLCYFIPYCKGKGIRDLYFIKTIRVGSKHEAHPQADPNDLRLVFEIEFVKQLFHDYKPISLSIWNTFTHTTLKTILEL